MRIEKRLRRGLGALLLVQCCAASDAVAGQWLADKSGCQVWDPNPQLEETVAWSGTCLNGRAEGAGTVEWLKNGTAFETDRGEWRDGKQGGKGVQNWPIGKYEGEITDGLPNGRGVLTLSKFRYEGQFRDGKPNGSGSLTQGSETVRGTWKDGCLQGGQRKAAIGIPLSACK